MDFYVLPGSEARARLKFACRIAEKAYLAGQRVFVWLEDAAELRSFDELLWTFADRSFVPHEIYGDARQWQDTPVLLGWETQPEYFPRSKERPIKGFRRICCRRLNA